MLLLVVLSAVGMYVVSLPVGTGESAGQYHRAAVARNMARAGVNAAIARLPEEIPAGSPYVRRIPVGPAATGRYSATSRKIPGAEGAPWNRPAPGIEEYELVSVGSVADPPDGDVRIVARVRYGPAPSGPRARIVKWVETGMR
jgi:hypothetical protein